MAGKPGSKDQMNIPAGWELVGTGSSAGDDQAPPQDQNKQSGVKPPPMQGAAGVPAPPSMMDRAIGFGKDMLTSPDTYSAIFSANPMAGAAIGAGGSILKDVISGETNPIKYGTHAIEHGAIGAIPFGLGKVMAGGAKPALEAGASMAVHGPVRGMLGNILAKTLGSNVTAQAAEALPKEAIAEYATPEILHELKQHILNLATQGKAFGDAEFDAADELYKRAMNYVETHGFDPAELAKTAKLTIQTGADKARAAAEQAVNAAKDRLNHYTTLAKLMTATASPYIFGTNNGVTPPPSSKP